MSAPEASVGHSAWHPSRGQVAVTAAVAFLLHLPALIRKATLNSDEATVATVARVMRHGGRLYTDVVDRKPPGAFVLYRLLEPIVGDYTLIAARWVALAAILVAGWVIAIEARRRWPNVSPLAVALLFIVAFSVLPAEDSNAAGFEVLATLPAVAAFVLGARRRTLLAGVALGVAALFKQPMLLGALPLMVQCLSAPGSRVQRLVRLAVAGAACVATVLIGLAPFGLGDALSWFAGNGDNYLGGTTLSTVLVVSIEQVAILVALTGGLLVFAVLAWGRKRLPMDLAVWIIASAFASAIGLRFLLHYFNQLLPALVLAAAPALVGREVFRQPGPRLAAVWLAGAATFSFVTLLAPDRFHDLVHVDRVASAVHARTVAGDKIFVWGQAPEIYWLSDRDPASRYPHVGFITGITPKRPGVPAYVLSTPEAAELLLRDLHANPPALIIDAAIATIRGGDRYPMATSPIAAFVDDGYCEVEVVDDITLLAPCG